MPEIREKPAARASSGPRYQFLQHSSRRHPGSTREVRTIRKSPKSDAYPIAHYRLANSISSDSEIYPARVCPYHEWMAMPDIRYPKGSGRLEIRFVEGRERLFTP